MIILGLNAYHADSSAALFLDGELVAAIAEERFRRVKHWAGFPTKAMEFCLRDAGITMKDVDYVTIGRDPRAKLGRKLAFIAREPFTGVKTVMERLQNRKKIASIQQELITHFGRSP